MALVELLPPHVLPLGKYIFRLATCSCGSVQKPQSTAVLFNMVYPPGTWMRGLESFLPASTNKTEWLGLAESRLANTHPADPAPIII